MSMRYAEYPLAGGVDGTSAPAQMSPGRLRIGINVESKPGGGYRRVLGYVKFDTAAITGEGVIRGVHYYGGKVYAFRNAVGGATCSMWYSTGSGWTEAKSGLAPDGTYRLVNYDFNGTEMMYGVSGTHKAFQWDGTTWTDITTGMAIDAPSHITAHRKHLFLSFGRSVQHSSLGDPLDWSALTGAAEILLTSSVTGFSTLSTGALGIFTANSIHLLGGTSAADWVANNMVEYSNNAGALPGTIQAMGSRVRFTDSRGVTDLAASDIASDFYEAIISHDMDKDIGSRWANAISSTVVRSKSQYRLFFSDRDGLILTFNNDSVMITRMILPITVNCIINTESSSGEELIYFGSTDGYIYRMESGNSFSGAAIAAHAETAFTNVGRRTQVKRWRRMRANIGSSGNSELFVRARYYIGNDVAREAGAANPDMETTTDTSPLGLEATLGQTLLGGIPIKEGEVELAGHSEYVSFRFFSESASSPPWEIDGITIEFLEGKKRR
jgi:hypothetical protein